ncbi:hypothetical protein HKBW3S03_01888, partial [Candidatus Hakubella thermalkaliphila]
IVPSVIKGWPQRNLLLSDARGAAGLVPKPGHSKQKHKLG